MTSDSQNAPEQRVDKWLWAARFFKTRSAAAEAVSGGKVHVNGGRVKPSRGVRIGDELEIRRGEERFVVTVLALNMQRRPAAEAQRLYAETDESRDARERVREERRLLAAAQPHLAGRPSKRDRRNIRHFIGKD